MQRHSERLVLHYDLKLAAYGRCKFARERYDLTPLTLRQIAAMIDTLHRARALPARKGKHETLYLADFSLDPAGRFATFLLNCSDRKVADPVFSDPDARTRRQIARDESEGGDFSAHFVVALDAHLPDRYRLVLELAPGLPGPKVQRYIRSLLAACFAANKNAFLTDTPSGHRLPNGTIHKLRLKHSATLLGHPSSQFRQEFEAGKVLTFDLISEQLKNRNWDGNGYVIEHARSIRLKQGGGGIQGSKIAALTDVCARAMAQNFEKIKIVYKTDAGIHRTVDLMTATVTLADDLRFIEKSLIDGFTGRLATSFAAIHDEIHGKMVPLLR